MEAKPAIKFTSLKEAEDFFNAKYEGWDVFIQPEPGIQNAHSGAWIMKDVITHINFMPPNSVSIIMTQQEASV